jgi:hypothetical protein
MIEIHQIKLNKKKKKGKKKKWLVFSLFRYLPTIFHVNCLLGGDWYLVWELKEQLDYP